MRDQVLLERARSMRREQTGAEQKLWRALRGKSFEGASFRRQVVVGPYIADFSCRSARLIVEVDGETHAGRQDYDARRTAVLESKGYPVMRFTNDDVLKNLEGVLQALQAALLPPLPSAAAGTRESNTFVGPSQPLPLPASGERA